MTISPFEQTKKQWYISNTAALFRRDKWWNSMKKNGADPILLLWQIKHESIKLTHCIYISVFLITLFDCQIMIEFEHYLGTIFTFWPTFLRHVIMKSSQPRFKYSLVYIKWFFSNSALILNFFFNHIKSLKYSIFQVAL